MSRNGWIGSTLSLLLTAAPTMRAQETAPGDPPERKAESGDKKDNTFKLGEVTVVVTANLDPIETANTNIEAEQIQEMNRDTVSSALELLPGISTTVGTRNEQGIYVRGFDTWRVPLFIDGVPSYVPYDGYMDFARFTTFDLSEIQVAKGFSSVTYGANTLGGAINLVTRRPTEPVEGDIRLGAFGGGGRKAAINFGTNQGRWYLQASGSCSQADNWRMSSDFKPGKYENGEERNNSDFSDKRYSIKLGFTPNDQDEYVIGASRQMGDKGQPPSTDDSIKATKMKYWRWPAWDKDSLFLATNTAIGGKSYVKFNAYFDTYKNTMFTFKDDTYSTVTSKSYYDDFTRGAKLEAGTMLLPRQSLKAVINAKTDVHRDDAGTHASKIDWTHDEDQYLNWGIEDTISLPANVDLSLGAGYDHMKPVQSSVARLPASRSFFHTQVGLFWRVAPGTQIYATYAQKNRFPTLKERYSQKFSTYWQNPDLKPEQSENWEIGAKTRPVEWLELNAALFQSNIRDYIQEKTNVVISGESRSQLQNIGKVKQSGVEVSADFKPSPVFHAGLGYTYLDRENKSDPDTHLTGTPRNRATGYVRWEPVQAFYVLTSIQYQDSLLDSNTSNYSTVALDGFTTVDLTLGWKPTSRLLIDAGLTNLFDRNYQLSYGYPLPGRIWFVNSRYRF